MKTNEFGVALDRNGYAPSIMQMIPRGRTCCCYLCGKPGHASEMDRHEPWGAANRQKSKELGLWVELHHWGCHEGPDSVHGGNGAAARQLRADAQTAAMLRYGWSRERWIEEFGKSELTEEECERISAPAAPAHRKQESAAPAGGGAMDRVTALIREFWPEQTAPRSSGFRLIDGPDLPF